MKTDLLQNKMRDLEQKGLRRTPRVISSSQGREITSGGRTFLNFCSNNYLGLADHPLLKQAAVQSIEREGLGAGASRLVCGTMSAHTRLEEKLARFKGTECAMIFNSGYQANVGIISALFGRGDMIFSDRLNHASIVDGILLSGATCERYPHKDMSALEEMLRKAPQRGQRVIVTDTVFSMDGDIAPLPEIVRLAKAYDCWVMVDEAHALGVLGASGRGAIEHFGLEGRIDIQMGTLSKAVGAFGAYVCGTRALIDFLTHHARSFIYTTALPPAVAAAAEAGIDIIEKESVLRKQLWENTRYLLSGLKRSGFNTLATETPIIPVVVGEAAKTVSFSERLFAAGIYVPAIRPPTVPAHTSRLRVTVMATHRREDLECLLSNLEKIGKDLCL